MPVNYLLFVKYFTMCMAVYEHDYIELCKSPIRNIQHIDFDRTLHVKCTHRDLDKIEILTYDLNFYSVWVHRVGEYKFTFDRFLRDDIVHPPVEEIQSKTYFLELIFKTVSHKPSFEKDLYFYNGMTINMLCVLIMWYLIDFKSIISLIFKI